MGLIVGTYAIAKNESKHVDRWADSLAGMDWIGCLDTGSTDNTVELMSKRGVHVTERKIDPWRFDHARNVSMSTVPDDVQVLLWLDIDEVLEPGWREHLVKAYDPKIDQYQVWYTWGHGRSFFYDKFHRHDRKRHVWKHPVHEVLYVKSGPPMVKVRCPQLRVTHLADPTKSRSNYLPLLEMSVKEDPHNDRNSHYYARELYFYKMDDLALKEFERHLGLPSAKWAEERCASCRYMAKIMRRRGDKLGEYKALLRALSECPTSREAWLELAQNRDDVKDYKGMFAAALNASNLVNRGGSYIEEDWAWTGSKLWDMLANSCWYAMGGQACKALGLEWAKKALDAEPNSERLKKNISFWEEL